MKVIETIKDIALVGGVLLFLLLAAGGLYLSIHGSGKGHIVVTAMNGRSSTKYRTTQVRRRGDCVSFLCSGDSMTVCGNYRIGSY